MYGYNLESLLPYVLCTTCNIQLLAFVAICSQIQLTRFQTCCHLQDLTAPITVVTLGLYNYVIEKLPPTPSRFHYIFNLRDLSRVYEGLTLSTIDKVKTVAQMVRLWRNECLRIFYDRLINDGDKSIVEVILVLILKTQPSLKHLLKILSYLLIIQKR